jgi:hypothetical protein
MFDRPYELGVSLPWPLPPTKFDKLPPSLQLPVPKLHVMPMGVEVAGILDDYSSLFKD